VREGLNLASLQPEPPELSERLTLYRNDLHARAYRFLEGTYIKIKSVFIRP
jgi:hypothetical protein